MSPRSRRSLQGATGPARRLSRRAGPPSVLDPAGATVVDSVVAALTLALIAWLGWWQEAGLGRPRPDRSWWLLLPLPAEVLAYAVPGLAGESLSRGLVQHLRPLGPAAAAVWVGVLFGAGHALNGVWFGRDPVDTAYVVIGAGVYGFCLAAARWHVRSLWPLVALHALTDAAQLASPGNLPFGLRVAMILALAGCGWWLLRLLARRPAVPAAGTRW